MILSSCRYKVALHNQSTQAGNWWEAPGKNWDTKVAVVYCRTAVIEDNPRVPKPEPARPSPVRDEAPSKEGTVQVFGGDTPARRAPHLMTTC